MKNKINLTESVRDRFRVLAGTITEDVAEENEKQRLTERKQKLDKMRKNLLLKEAFEAKENKLFEDENFEVEEEEEEEAEGEMPPMDGDEEGGMPDLEMGGEESAAPFDVNSEDSVKQLAQALADAIESVTNVKVSVAGGEEGGEGEEMPDLDDEMPDLEGGEGEEMPPMGGDEEEIPEGLMQEVYKRVVARLLREVKKEKAVPAKKKAPAKKAKAPAKKAPAKKKK